MAEAEPVQSVPFAPRVLLFALLTWALAVPVMALAEPVGDVVAHPAIKRTAVAPVVLWFAAAPVLFAIRWVAPRRFVAVAARAGWVAGCVLLLLHIAVAFHLGHGWSHAAAWEHTRRVGGYGWGVFVNYAFALMWLVDGVWACAAPESYNARPLWLHGAVHVFLAFIVANAAVVFGGEEIRIVSALLVLCHLPLVVLWLRVGRGRAKAASELTSEGSASRGA